MKHSIQTTGSVLEDILDILDWAGVKYKVKTVGGYPTVIYRSTDEVDEIIDCNLDRMVGIIA